MRASDKKNRSHRILHDPDLAVPGHDRIMLWLEEHLESILGDKPKDVRWEYPIVDPLSRTERIVGFADLWADFTFFEVKSEIRSIGEVIRQIRYYQHFTKPAQWIVVAPPGAHAEVFKRQGIRFVACPESVWR